MTTNKPNVQRYDTRCPEEICRVDTMCESDDGDYVLYEDYKALHAECDHYKSVAVGITTRHFVERWANTASDKELEQYLSDGITQLEGEYRKQIEALQAESELLRAAIRRLCNIYVVDDYYDGQLREERLEVAVNRAINAIKESSNAND